MKALFLWAFIFAMVIGFGPVVVLIVFTVWLAGLMRR